jgi:hypothetical protein
MSKLQTPPAKKTSPLVTIAVVGLFLFGIYAVFNFASFNKRANATQQADYHGLTLEDVKSDVEEHLRKVDNIASNATVDFASIDPASPEANGDYTVPILVRVETPSQNTQKVVATLTIHSDASYSVKTSLDPDVN